MTNHETTRPTAPEGQTWVRVTYSVETLVDTDRLEKFEAGEEYDDGYDEGLEEIWLEDLRGGGPDVVRL